MKLKPDTIGMTVMLASMTALGPLATDMYLPSMPTIGLAFHVSDAAVQQTLSAYLIGFAVGQIFYGPLADRYGRKPVLLAGFALFIAASLGCSFAGSIRVLILTRVFQAFGAAGPIILARAMVRDLYHGPRAGRELSRMGTIMGVTPAAAPLLGGLLQRVLGWQSNFYIAAVAATVMTICAACFLPETLRAKTHERFSAMAVLRTFSMVLGNHSYRIYVALLTLSYSGLFAYLSATSFVLQGVYGFGELVFSILFGLCACAYVTGTIVASRILPRRGINGTIAIGVIALMLGGVMQLVGMAIWPALPECAVVPMMVYLFGIGLTLPQTMAACMEPFPDHAGAASSLAGLIQMSVSALAGMAVGEFLAVTPLALPIATAFMGTGSYLVFRLAPRAQTEQGA